MGYRSVAEEELRTWREEGESGGAPNHVHCPTIIPVGTLIRCCLSSAPIPQGNDRGQPISTAHPRPPMIGPVLGLCPSVTGEQQPWDFCCICWESGAPFPLNWEVGAQEGWWPPFDVMRVKP